MGGGQAKAYRAVRTALEAGKLRRAAFCSRCGAADKRGSDGRSTIHAHHLAGYDEPLLVEWLCALCHRAETPLPENPGTAVFGMQNGFAKLTDEQVAEIKSSALSGAEMARQLGVDRSTVNKIRRGIFRKSQP